MKITLGLTLHSAFRFGERDVATVAVGSIKPYETSVKVAKYWYLRPFSVIFADVGAPVLWSARLILCPRNF